MRKRLAELTIPEYLLREDLFALFRDAERAHQRSAFDFAQSTDHGQILSPCGTGKTRIQAAIQVADMLANRNNSSVYVIASHRLVLNRQLLDELADQVITTGIPCDILFNGSLHDDLDSYYLDYAHIGYSSSVSEYDFTTDPIKIEAFVKRAKSRGRHVLIVSTYHSFANLSAAGLIQLATFDEAHNLTEDRFRNAVEPLLPSITRKYFFTATRRVGELGAGIGMDDISFFGPVLFDAPPSKMLLAGEIVCPRLHYVDTIDPDATTSANNITMLVENLIVSYTDHHNWVKAYSAFPDKIAAKLLVACGGVDEMMDIYRSPVFIAHCQANDIRHFAISAEHGGFYNGEQVSKSVFVSKMQALTDTDKAIILNVDILTQGIDLPSITGVMPMRMMSKLALLQLLGRCLRLHAHDRPRIYAKDITVIDHKQDIPSQGWAKPFGWIVIPRHLRTMEHYAEMVHMVEAIVDEYKTPADRVVHQDIFTDRNHDTLDPLIPMRRTHGAIHELVSTEVDIACQANKNRFTREINRMSQEAKQILFEELGL